MGSPGCEHMGCTVHSPLYVSHPHTDAWRDKVEDIKPPRTLLGLPELSWPGVYLPGCDKSAADENPWVLRMTESPASNAPPSRTPDLIPPASSQASADMEGQVDECPLEQVQTMVVGEVLKDIDTACKLLNIAAGNKRTQQLIVISSHRLITNNFSRTCLLACQHLTQVTLVSI